MRRPAAVPHECGEPAPPAPHASEGVGQAETKESLRLPHLPHLPHRVSATGMEKHGMRRKTESLAALAARWGRERRHGERPLWANSGPAQPFRMAGAGGVKGMKTHRAAAQRVTHSHRGGCAR